MEYFVNHVEALIFASTNPITAEEIKNVLEEMFSVKIADSDIHFSLQVLEEKYRDENYAMEVLKIGGGYQFLTKLSYQQSIKIFLKQQSKKKLSTSTLETLAIIAYKQPITKQEIEKIRGMNSDYTVQKLLEKELVIIKGKLDTVGKPLIYGTSTKFMDYFGINDINELPALKDFFNTENTLLIEDKQE
ncbi:MAG: SMC-Scp complex subunit ScpB [Chitinophagaceae bacterium]|nr:SMC-Scp complex subunit ScpB [Chitinophagaceae bacterium]